MLYASPAYDGAMIFENSDGSTFTGKLKGSPWFHFVVDTNDKISILNKTSGNYEYADYDNANNKLILSGVVSGTAAGVHGAISAADLSSAWQTANAANPAAQAQTVLITMIQGQWYEVRDPVPAAGAPAQLFSAYLDNGITGLEIQQTLPNTGPMKNDLVHLDGQKLVNDTASGNAFRIYQTFSQQSGYIEVKNYSQDANGIQLNYTSRWYANQTDATNYYNTL